MTLAFETKATEAAAVAEKKLSLAESQAKNATIGQGVAKDFKEAARLFEKALCSVCHVPELPVDPDSRASALAGTTIRPFTDLLLHDMGAGLADRRSEFLAGGRDWRTPPLWGLGLRREVSGNVDLLHDGRARNVTEAIMWHGGEATISRDTFIKEASNPRPASTQETKRSTISGNPSRAFCRRFLTNDCKIRLGANMPNKIKMLPIRTIC